MNEYFPSIGFAGKPFVISDEGISYNGVMYEYRYIQALNRFCEANVFMNGVYNMLVDGREISLCYANRDKARAQAAFAFAVDQLYRIHDASGNPAPQPAQPMNGPAAPYPAPQQNQPAVPAENAPRMYRESADPNAPVYNAESTLAILKVYPDYCVLTAKKNAWNLLIQDKYFNGEKKYYYADLTAVQFREPGSITDGYIEFEYPGSRSGTNTNAYTSENSFQFGKTHTMLMREIYEYIDGRIRDAKTAKQQPAVQVYSAAEELKKFKELMDMGIITQEEFDAKKKQILGL